MAPNYNTEDTIIELQAAVAHKDFNKNKQINTSQP